MDFEVIAAKLNTLLSERKPEILNSSWIFRHAPDCYRYIRKNIRSEWGTIDWDRVTSALHWKYQRLWKPKRKSPKLNLYSNRDEVDVVLNGYKDKLYVFIAPENQSDRHIRDIISIRLVRLSQRGNIAAKEEIMRLVQHAIDEWIDHSQYMSRWRGNNERLQEAIEGCVRRYRYTGSFFHYLHRTLQYAARNIQPVYTYSLDEPVALYANKRKIENVVRDPETGEIGLYGM